MTRHVPTIIVLWSSLAVASTYPYSDSNPPYDKKVPEYKPTKTKGKFPFQMTLPSTDYKPGSIITDSVIPDAGHTIEGFLIQAKADNGNGALIGEFKPNTNELKTVCGEPEIPFDSECGRTKGCFPDCRNYTCTYLVTWTDKNDTVEFELSSAISVGTDDKYVAIGYSNDQTMSDSSVAECLTINRTFMAGSSFNTEDYTNVVLENKTLGMTLLAANDTDGVFYCKFRKIKYIPNQKEYYDLNSNWTLLFATGMVEQGVLPGTLK